MSKKTALHRLAAPLFALGIGSLVFSGSLITEHIRIVKDVQKTSVPLVLAIPEMEQRSAVLQEQLELAELNAALKTGSHQEQIDVYVLPEEHDIDRLVALFDVFKLAFETRDDISNLSALTIGDEVAYQDHIRALPLSFSVSAYETALPELLHLLRLAGAISVADVLSQQEIDALLVRLESDSPAGIVPVERFLSLDLLEYAKEPKAYEEPLRRSFSSPQLIAVIDALLSTPILADARMFLSGHLGTVVEQQNLWPMPMMTIEEVTAQTGGSDGWYRLSINTNAYRKS